MSSRFGLAAAAAAAHLHSDELTHNDHDEAVVSYFGLLKSGASTDLEPSVLCQHAFCWACQL